MKKPGSMKSLEDLGRVRLSKNFFLRDFLHSEIAEFYGIPNIPDDPELAIEAGRKLCGELLEPLEATFGRLLELLGRALAAPPGPAGWREASTIDGRLRVELGAPDGTAATIRAPGGLLTAPNYQVRIVTNAAADRRELGA